MEAQNLKYLPKNESFLTIFGPSKRCYDLFERQPELKYGFKCPLNGMGVVAQFDGTQVRDKYSYIAYGSLLPEYNSYLQPGIGGFANR